MPLEGTGPILSSQAVADKGHVAVAATALDQVAGQGVAL